MNGTRNDPHSASAGFSPLARDLIAKISKGSGRSASRTAKPPSTRAPIARPMPTPHSAIVGGVARGYSSNARTMPSSAIAMTAANGPSLALMNMCP